MSGLLVLVAGCGTVQPPNESNTEHLTTGQDNETTQTVSEVDFGCPYGYTFAINDSLSCCPIGLPYIWSDTSCHYVDEPAIVEATDEVEPVIEPPQPAEVQPEIVDEAPAIEESDTEESAEESPPAAVLPDSDSDGIPDELDNCPLVSNVWTSDSDNDGVGDFCDNCLFECNSDQLDSNRDGFGDACDFSLVSWQWTGAGELSIADKFGDDVFKLSDGSIWEVTFEFTFGWNVGDNLLVETGRLTNLDELEDVYANHVGHVLLSSRIADVSDDLISLSDGSIWRVTFGTFGIWLGTNVVVMKGRFFDYSLIDENDGDMIDVRPLYCLNP